MESNPHHTEHVPNPKLTRRRDAINLNYLLSLGLRYWYFFLISLPITLAWVFVSLRYDIPQYQSSCTMVIRSADPRTPSGSYIIEGIGLSPEDQNIENQIFTMQSYRMTRKTVERLDYEVEYYSDGRFKDTELYHQCPFEVVIDSGIPHLLETPITILLLDDGKVEVSVNTEGGSTYLMGSQQVVGSTGAINYKKIIDVNKKTATPFGTFAIRVKNPSASAVGYYYMVRTVDAIASELRSSLNVSALREGASIISLSVTGKTPPKLKGFLDEFCKVVVENNLEQKNQIADKSLAFIQRQLESIADTLDRTQDVLLRFKQENGFMSPVVASEQVSEQYLEAESSKKEIALKREYYSMVKRKLMDDPFSSDYMLPAFTDDNVAIITQMIMSIIEVNTEIVEVKKAGGSSPLLSSLNNKNSQLRNDLLLSIDKFLENLALNEEVVDREIVRFEAHMNTLPELEKRFLNIDRKYKLNDAIYTFLLQKNSEMQISKASNTTDNEVVDQAYVSGPISPNPSKSYQKALMLGLILPIGFIALIEFLNVKIRTKDELEALLPETPVVGLVPHGKAVGQVLVVEQHRSVLAESFRTIRTRLNFMRGTGRSSVLTITSTNSGDGKTFISTNLAAVFAMSGKKTVVLGFDLRKPKLNDSFNLNHTKGISNYLIGEVGVEDICFPSSIQGLFVIPSGDIPPNPSELVGMPKTGELFEWLRENFEIIIVDSPPIGVVSDARVLMHYSDAQLYIVRSNYTRKDHLQLTMSGLYAENVHGLGLIFNDVEVGAANYGSYYLAKE